jgi:hypothetical protein
MDITTVPTRAKPLALSISCILLTLTGTGQSVMAAETRLTPSIRSSVNAYQVRTAETNGTEDGLAWELAPALSFDRRSKNMQTGLRWQHETLLYDDATRDNQHYNEFDFVNLISAYQRRVNWGINANQGYRVRNTQNGIFSDKITGSGNLSKVASHGTFLNLQTSPVSGLQARLNLAYNQNKAAESENDTDIGSAFRGFSNEIYRADLSLGSGQRRGQAFWRLNTAYSNTKREDSQDYTSRNGSVLLGFPLFSRLSIVGRGSYEFVDNNNSYFNDFSSVGAGAELHFGMASRISVSVNRGTNDRIIEKDSDTPAGFDIKRSS